jgi:hypothetical protein
MSVYRDLSAVLIFGCSAIFASCSRRLETQVQPEQGRMRDSTARPLPPQDKRSPDIEIWLGREIESIRGRQWPMKSGAPVEGLDLPGATFVRLHVGEKLVYDSTSAVSFLTERHGKLASVTLTPSLLTRRIDESYDLVRKLAVAVGRSDEVGSMIATWRAATDNFSRTGRLTFDDDSNVDVVIRPFYDSSGEWYLSLEFTASWFLDNVNGKGAVVPAEARAVKSAGSRGP